MKAIRWIGWVALAALFVAPLAATPAWAAWSGTTAVMSQPSAKAGADSCNILDWRTKSATYKTRWYNYAGPARTGVPVLSFKIINSNVVADTLISMYVHSLNERSSAISKISLYRDATANTAPDSGHYFTADDALLQTLTVSTLFQTNDSILFSGLSNVIAATDSAWYHLVVDMNTAAITGQSTYNGTGVMVDIRTDKVTLGQAGARNVGPSAPIPNPAGTACTPTSAPNTNNAYSIIIDNQAPLCDTLNLSFLQDVTCPPCDGSEQIINLGDSLLITLNLDSTGNIAIDSCVTGWPKVFVREFTNNSGAVSMGRVKGWLGWNNFVYVSDPDSTTGATPNGFKVPTSGVNHPIDVDTGFYYLVAETKDVAGNVGRCSTLVNYKIDTKKPAITNAPTFTLYYDANGNGIVNPGDTVRIFLDMSNEPFGEICATGVSTFLYGWYNDSLPLTLTNPAGDRKFESKFPVDSGALAGTGILDCVAGAWQDSIWIHVTDNACNNDSVRAVLNSRVDNQGPQASAWTPTFDRLLDTDSNGCLMIGEKVRIRITNVNIDTDVVAIYANLLKAGLGDSAGVFYAQHPLYNQGGGVWLLDWTLGDEPQDSAVDTLGDPVWLYAVDDAGNWDSTTAALAYNLDTEYPLPVKGLSCTSEKDAVIRLDWYGDDPDAGRFAIYWNGPGGGAAAINYTTPLAMILNGTATTWSTDGTVTLVNGTMYKFDVWTRDDCGNWEQAHPTPVACVADNVPPQMCVIQPDTGGTYCSGSAPTIYTCPKDADDRDVSSVAIFGRLINRGDNQPGPWIWLGGSSTVDGSVCFSVGLNGDSLNVIVGPDTVKAIELICVGTDQAGNESTKLMAYSDCSPVFHFRWSNQDLTGHINTINGQLPLYQPYCQITGWTLSGPANTVAICVDRGIPPFKVIVELGCQRGKQPGPGGDTIYYAEGQPACTSFNLDVSGMTKGLQSFTVTWIDACGKQEWQCASFCIPDSLAPCAIVSNPVDGKCIRRSRSMLDPIGAYEAPITITITGNDLTPNGNHCIDQNGVLKVDFQWSKSCCVGGVLDTTGWQYFTRPSGSVSPGTTCDTTYFPPPFETFIQKIVCAGVDTIVYVLDSTAVTTSCDAGWNTFAILQGNQEPSYSTDWWNTDDLAWVTASGTNIWLRGVIYDDQGNIFYTPCVQVCVDIDTPPMCLWTPDVCDGNRISDTVSMIAELNWPLGNVDDIENVYLYYKKSSQPDVFSSWTQWDGAGSPGTNSTMWRWDNLLTANLQDQTYYDFRVIAKTTWGTWSYDLNGDQQFDAHTFDTTNCDAKTWLVDRTAPKIAIDTAWTTINGNPLVIPNASCRLSDPKGYVWTQFGHSITIQPSVYPLADKADVVKVQWTLYDGYDGATCGCDGPYSSFYDGDVAHSYVFAVNQGASALNPLVFDPSQAPFVAKTNGVQQHVLHLEAWDACGNKSEDCINVYLLDVDTTDAIIIDPMNDKVFCDQNPTDNGTITLTARTLLNESFNKAVFSYRASGATTWIPIDSVGKSSDWGTTGDLSVSWNPRAAGLADGKYELTVVAYDNALNRQANTYITTVFLSCAVPTVAMTSPTAGVFIGCPLELTATASSGDPHNPITDVCFYVQSITSSTRYAIGCDNNTVDGTWSIHWDPHGSSPNIYDGQYYIFAVATNKAGATTTSAMVMVRNDETDPWSKVIQVNGDRSDGGAADPTTVEAGLTVPLYVLAADDQSPSGYGLVDNCGLDSVVVYVTDNAGGLVVFGQLMTPVDSLSSLYMINWNTTGLKTGVYRVSTKAIDCACNSSTCNNCWWVKIVNPAPSATIAVLEAVPSCGYATVKSGTGNFTLTPEANADITEVQFWRAKSTSSDVHDQWTLVGIQPTPDGNGVFTVAADIGDWSEGLWRIRAFYKSTDGTYVDDGNSNGDFDDFTFDPAHKPWQMMLQIDRSVTPFTVALDPNMTLKSGKQVKVTVTPDAACDVAQVCYGVVAENGNYGQATNGCTSATTFSFNPVDSGLVSLDHGIWHGSVRATVSDAMGNTAFVEQPLWILDMDSTQVRVTSPVHGEYVTGVGDTLASVTARRLTSATGGASIDSVRFWWGPASGAGTYIGKGLSSGETYTSNWNIKNVPEGEHYIWGEAYHGSTKLDSNPYRVWVIVVKSPTNIVLLAPNPSTQRTVGPDVLTFVGGRVDLCLNRDSISSIVSGVGIDSVVFGYRFGDAPGGPVPNSPDPAQGWVRIDADRYGSLCVDWFACDTLAETCQDGRHALVAWVYDKAGHVNHSNIVHVMVDCTEPYSEIVDIDGDETFGDCHDITLNGDATLVKFKANAVDDKSCAGTTPSYNSGAKYLQFFVGQCGAGGGGAADVVFVVDGSGSMSGDQAAIANNVASFFTGLSGVDARYGVLAYTDIANPVGTNGIFKTGGAGTGEFTTDAATLATMVTAVGDTGSGTENGLTALNNALAWYPWRAGATKVLILVTDENADDLSDFATLQPPLLASGAMINTVVDFGDSTGYSALAPATNGLALDITTNWGSSLTALASQIAAVVGGSGNDDGIIWGKQVVLTDGQADAFALWNPTGLPTGTYCVWTTVVDAVGNSYTSAPVHMCIYDKTPPVGYIAGFGVSTDEHMNHRYTIYGRSWDTDIDHVQFQYRKTSSTSETDWTGIGVSAMVNGDSTCWMTVWNPCISSLAGEYEMRMVPTDKSGNENFEIQPKLVVTLDGACNVTPKDASVASVAFEDRAFANLGLVNVNNAPTDKHSSMIAVYADLKGGLDVEKINLRQDMSDNRHYLGSFNDGAILNGGSGWFWVAYSDTSLKKTYLKLADLNVYMVDNVGFPGTLTNATTGAKVTLDPGAITSTNGVVIFPARIPTVWLDQQHLVAWPTSAGGNMLTAIRLTSPLEYGFNTGSYAEVEISYSAGVPDGDLSIGWWDGDRWNTTDDIKAGGAIANGKAKFFTMNLHGVYAVVSKGGILNKGAVEVQPTTFLPMVGTSTNAWPTFHTVVRSKLNLEYENSDIDRYKIIAVLDGGTIFTDNVAASGWYGSWDEVSGLLELAPDPLPLCGGGNTSPGGSTKPTHTLPGLATGPHTIVVQAFNKQGYYNVDTTRFTVDATHPNVEVTGGYVCPNPTFTFDVTDLGVGVNWDSVFIDVFDITGSTFSDLPKSRLIHTESPDAFTRTGSKVTFTLTDQIVEGRRLRIVIYDGVRDIWFNNECSCEYVSYDHPCNGVPDMVGNHTQVVEEDYTVSAIGCVNPGGGDITVAQTSGSSNPFDPSAGEAISFNLNGFAAGGGSVTVAVYDLTGELVTTLKANALQGTSWDGRNDKGDIVAQGVYLVHFQRSGGLATGLTSQTIKAVVRKK